MAQQQHQDCCSQPCGQCSCSGDETECLGLEPKHNRITCVPWLEAWSTKLLSICLCSTYEFETAFCAARNMHQHESICISIWLGLLAGPERRRSRAEPPLPARRPSEIADEYRQVRTVQPACFAMHVHSDPGAEHRNLGAKSTYFVIALILEAVILCTQIVYRKSIRLCSNSDRPDLMFIQLHMVHTVSYTHLTLPTKA